MSQHHDVLEDLNRHIPIRDKLIVAHKSVSEIFPFIARIAVAIYDPKTTLLKTFIHSSGEDNPLDHYQAQIEDAPSLKQLLDQGLPRVINDMVTFENGRHEHTQRIGRQGYGASYTLPIFNEGMFIGFIFFNSYEKDVFTESALRQIDIYGHLIALMVIHELESVKTLTAAIVTTGRITHVRDDETGSHLDRMSRYSRVIANALADTYHLDDDYIERVFMYSPLHDIGKIGIPDKILLKPGKLDEAEMSVMKNHAMKGRKIIDDIIENFGLENVKNINLLRHIAEYHHETIDGSGYPHGVTRDEIPLEARIVAVADVFDALTSKRPYKKAWSNEQAVATLRELAGEKLDEDCVMALLDNMGEVECIQQQFRENNYI